MRPTPRSAPAPTELLPCLPATGTACPRRPGRKPGPPEPRRYGAAVKLSTQLAYDGNPRAAADAVVALERAGLDTGWGAGGYGVGSPPLLGDPAARAATGGSGAGGLHALPPA